MSLVCYCYIYGNQLLSKALLSRRSLTCVTVWITCLLQVFIHLRTVALESEFKCNETAKGNLSLIPQGSEPHNWSPQCLWECAVGTSILYTQLAWRMAHTVHDGFPPGDLSDNPWCVWVPGHQLSERTWPLKDTLGNLKAIWQQAPLSLPFSTVFNTTEVGLVSDFGGHKGLRWDYASFTKIKVEQLVAGK